MRPSTRLSRPRRQPVRVQCLKKSNDWRQCEAAREAMDTCLEDGERQRFHLDAECSRWKRKVQSCLLDAKNAGHVPEIACEGLLARLLECADAACTEHRQRRASNESARGPKENC